MATILSFSTHGHQRPAPRGDVRGEVIVFPRTDIRALHRWSAAGTDEPSPAERATAPMGEGDPA